jgi:vacuolar-type H+-ATPase subunit I/STV1
MNSGGCVRGALVAIALALAAAPAGADDEQDAAGRTHAELDRFQTWFGQQIDALKQEIDELQRELEGSDAAERDRVAEMIRQAEELADDLREQAAEIGEATAEQWEGAKASALSGWHRVRAAYYAALAELRGSGDQDH